MRTPNGRSASSTAAMMQAAAGMVKKEVAKNAVTVKATGTQVN